MKIGLYLRLSIADGDLGKGNKEESNSIENQRELLINFIKTRKDFDSEINVVEYIDDGYSGTNFNRPAFQKMIEDAKKGVIDTIITKDLSRLGRDYIGVGDYMEQIFPILGIRFIAVNSNYDSNDYVGRTMGLEMSINNLVNSLYSKDISKKITSALQTRWKQGITTYGCTPYGYYKDPHDKKKWIVDPESGPIVRLIFDKALAGWNCSMIANHLNEAGVIPPNIQMGNSENHTVVFNRKCKEPLWNSDSVRKVIKRIEYTGHLTQGKRKLLRNGSGSIRIVPDSEQFVIENHHEAIVSWDEFNKAQCVIRQQGYKMRQPTGNLLISKVVCGNCGLRMEYNKGGGRIACSHKANCGSVSACDPTKHDAKQLENIVFSALKRQISLFGSLNESMKDKLVPIYKEQKAELKRLNGQLETLKVKKVRLYEEYAQGFITVEQYKKTGLQITDAIKQLEEQSKLIQDETEYGMNVINSVETMAGNSDSLNNKSFLTRKMVETYVEQVTIYDKEHIEIKFVFEDLLKKAVALHINENHKL